MKKIVRKIAYLLLLTLVVNAGGWTFNQEAVADVMFDEQHKVLIDDQDGSAPSHQNYDTTKSPCNHWCHAVGHFMGLLSHWMPTTFDTVNDFSVQQVSTFPFPIPDSRFRPPRFLS